MTTANRLLLAVLFVTLFGCSNQAQKTADKYIEYDFKYGEYLFSVEKWDSAFLSFNRYVNNAGDSLKKGQAFRYMGVMQSNMGDLYGAQVSLLAAIHAFDSLNKDHQEDLGLTYNTLGNVSLDLKQYDEAIEQYGKAKTFLKGADYFAEVINGKATALQKKGDYHNAVATYDSALALKPADQFLVARIIDNRAKTRWLQDPGYPALPEFRAALKIRADSLYSLGLNASYSHISDYYAKSNPDSALWYANKMHATAAENQSPDDMLEAIDKMIRLNNAPALKEQWYEVYKKLNDSLQFSRNTTTNRFAMMKYDVQKSKADNLALQQHITTQRLFIFGVTTFALIVIAGISNRNRKRKKAIKQEAENTIRNSKLKTSQKVHDVIANGLYGIMNELEHNQQIEKEPLITKIEGLYEKSRDISYEDIAPGDSATYDNDMHDLLNSFANEQTKVIVVGNQPIFWNWITASQKRELQLVLNEIMINMKKHSHAKNVAIVFKQEHNKGFITYKDDGIGFPLRIEFGNGLNNTVSRIKSLNGAVNFEKSEKAGASISISFPLESGKT